VATATPARAADDLRPMSSRESAPPAGTTVGAPAGPVDASATLPPGHPPLEGAPPAGASLPSGHPPIGAAPAGATIAGTIALSAKLQAAPSDVLYVMAKKGTATLAVRRVEKPSFPFSFEISGGDVMMGGTSFQGPVDVVARLSKTGDAIPAKGDLEGVARNVKVPSKNVKLTIDTVRQ
jgi:cytochrome c-type biogenesis protein CcmH